MDAARTYSLEEAARACGLTRDWLDHSSWCVATTFHEARFRLETFTLDAALEFRTCWHTGACARFSSGLVTVDGGSNAIRDIVLAELPRPLTIMACSAETLLARRPGKYRPFADALRDPADLVAMDGNHRLAALAARRLRGIVDTIAEVRVFVCR